MTTTQQKLSRLAALADQRRHLNQEIDALVLMLRSPDMDGACEASWQEVGEALGVTKQSAHRMYRAVEA
jgi:hypothetical protein